MLANGPPISYATGHDVSLMMMIYDMIYYINLLFPSAQPQPLCTHYLPILLSPSIPFRCLAPVRSRCRCVGLLQSTLPLHAAHAVAPTATPATVAVVTTAATAATAAAAAASPLAAARHCRSAC